MIPLFDLGRSHDLLRDQFHDVLDQVINSSEYVLGSTVNRFEREFATYCGSDHAVAVNSGTSALHLALEASGVGPGDEVITTPMTFIATAAAISYTGAKPVFVDVDPDTWNINPQMIQKAITPRTKAIMPVHLHGLMANMPAIMDLADQNGIVVIEDAAQAHGASINGRRASTFGLVSGFSFYPGKNLGALGEAGAVVTNDSVVAERVRLMRNWGSPERYVHDAVAFNYRMDGVQGGFLSVKLRYMEAWNAQRSLIANKYTTAFTNAGIKCPTVPDGYVHAFHVYAILVDDRERMRKAFDRKFIGHGVHYPIAVHRQKAYEFLGYSKGSFPTAESLAEKFFSLPIFPGMQESEVDLVIQTVLEEIR
jgi:dTDP-4-amino-4,6-dideoxygalactose transaminase